jgi:hypothetical protein
LLLIRKPLGVAKFVTSVAIVRGGAQLLLALQHIDLTLQKIDLALLLLEFALQIGFLALFIFAGSSLVRRCLGARAVL